MQVMFLKVMLWESVTEGHKLYTQKALELNYKR